MGASAHIRMFLSSLIPALGHVTIDDQITQVFPEGGRDRDVGKATNKYPIIRMRLLRVWPLAYPCAFDLQKN